MVFTKPRALAIVSILLLFDCTAAQSWSMEIETASISSPSTIVRKMAKRIGSSFEKGKKPSLWSVTKEVKSKLFHTRATLGREYSPNPVSLDLSLTTEPNFSPEKVSIGRELKVSASRKLSRDLPPLVEVGFTHTNDRPGSVFMVCKFSF